MDESYRQCSLTSKKNTELERSFESDVWSREWFRSKKILRERSEARSAHAVRESAQKTNAVDPNNGTLLLFGTPGIYRRE
jgi:hypothetical protein